MHSCVYLTSIQRQVFYLDENGRIMSSNTTGINNWPTPYNILPSDSAMPGTKGLAVCADTDSNGLNGLRVYFGKSTWQNCSGDTLTRLASSHNGYIQEVGMNFNSDPWTLWAGFGDSDVYSGVATLLVDTVNHLYLVNSTTGSLVQWTWDYNVNDDTSWQKGGVLRELRQY
jgi:hypothetical protein